MKPESGSVGIAKITLPAVNDVVLRDRLFHKLDKCRSYPLIWISGPAGSGKTSLMATYLEARKSRCIWYDVDEGDTDIATFFHYMGLAARKATPKRRKRLPSLTREYSQDETTFALRYFESLYARLGIPSVLVFDNYHRLLSSSPLHEVIVRAVSVLPEGMNIVIASRAEPPPAFIGLRANSRMELLEWRDLRFTLKESEKTVKLRAPQYASGIMTKRLHQICDGWAAGLVLLLDSIKRGIDVRSFERSSPEKIISYFGNEIWNKIPSDRQQFLLKTAFLPNLTAKIADELVGGKNAGSILSALAKNNSFVMEQQASEAVYRYHPLFRNFLIDRAKDLLGKKATSDLAGKAALLLERSGYIEAAAKIFSEQNNFEELARIILKQAPSMAAQGRTKLLEDWLAKCPKSLRDQTPWLLYWNGVCLLPHNSEKALSSFVRSFHAFDAVRERPGKLLAWAGIVNVLIYGYSSNALDHWITALEDLTRESEELCSPEVGVRVATGMLSALTIRQPQHPRMDFWAEKALSLTDAPQFVNEKMLVLFIRVFLALMTGRFEEAAAAKYMMRQLIQSNNISHLSRIMERLAEALDSQINGVHDQCMEAVSEGLELSKTTGVHLLDSSLMAMAVASSLNANDIKTARQFLEQMSAIVTDRTAGESLLSRGSHLYHFMSAREALIVGDFRNAKTHIDLITNTDTKTGSSALQGLTCLLNAQITYRLGKRKESMQFLRLGLDIARSIKSGFVEFNAMVIHAGFALDEKDQKLALSLIGKALALGKEPKFLNSFVGQPSEMAKVCVKALEAGIETGYVREIIRRLKLMPAEPPSHLETWPWPVRIRALGGFSIEREGEPVRFARKAQEKPLSMLKALIALGGSEVPERSITDFVWPEVDGDLAHRSFQVTLHRLRTLLGLSEAISFGEGRLTLDPRYCWVDVWAFEDLFEETVLRLREGLAEQTIESAENAIGLYRGPFLGEETDQLWVGGFGEQLRNKFLEIVKILGVLWCRAGEWAKARDCYLRGLKAHELHEEFCRGLLICYRQLDQRTEALLLYRNFEEKLKAVFGIEPSAKTKALRDALV